MKAGMLKEITKGDLESKSLLRLVFTRSAKVIGGGLIFTLILWLIQIQEYVLGFFLLGSALGVFVFWILGFLKKHLGYQSPGSTGQDSEDLNRTNGIEKLTGPKEISPKTPVEG